MPDVRGVTRHPLIVLAIGVVCLCVVMQMLGTTMTMWDFQYPLDPVNAPLLEGFSLPTAFVGFQPVTVVWSTVVTAPALHPVLCEQTLFRHPNCLL
jgi:hypothetical protein